HHMFAVGMGPIADTVFGLTTMLIAIPTGVKIFNWTFTMWGGSIRFTTAMKFAIGLVSLFVIGGVSGVMHASPPADLQQTDTYFIVAHFHYVLAAGALMGIFAGVYYYYPKMTGRLLSERLGSWHFWLWFVGVNLTFMPMHWSGLAGMSRRIYQYDAGQGYDIYNAMSSWGAYIQAVALIVFFVNMFWSRKKGAVAGGDPWGAPTLEWSMPSPPPDYNFAKVPRVTSRYPMWDVMSPELTADVPHTHAGDRHVEVDLAGKEVGSAEIPDDRNRQAPEAGMHVEGRLPTARQLGIPMPNPSAMPIVVAFFMVLMFGFMIFYHTGHSGIATGGIIASALMMTLALYNWLLTPLEDHH
ncbi:MAG TPA: cbb3-type cytochrome c oxidase subunit I, partial [Gemmatimonadaceae bacterium]|nr:cbb3-type cytochrome c oxidase subunit I [Gemmatimonadaceae bacterium]